MSNRLTLVPRAPIAAFVTCPLCQEFFEEATTIPLCLHTFCKKCIYDKFSDEENDTCPVCDTYLGYRPKNLLRPDRALQSIRDKVFPEKKRPKAFEISQSGAPPPTPNVSDCSSQTEKRPKSKLGSKKSSLDKMEEDNVKATSSAESISKPVPKKKLVFSKDKSLNNQNFDGDSARENQWQPLNCLFEAANMSKISKSKLNMLKAAASSARDVDIETIKAKWEKHALPMTSVTAAPVDSSDTAQAVADVARFDQKDMPIWFSLDVCEDEEEATRLPQLASRFLRLKNGEMPVSYLQKYIAMKFELVKEEEVEIKLKGEALLPSIRVCDILDKWIKSGPPSGLIRTKVGDSTPEFVMPLSYSRKLEIQAPFEDSPKNSTT